MREKGFFLVFVALLALVLVSFCALVVGLGFVSTGKQFLQNSTNLAALAALEDFVVNSEESNFQTRITRAKERADLILSRNEIMGVEEAIKPLGFPENPGEGGIIKFGMWYQSNPDGTGGSGPCITYPCFQEINSHMGNPSPHPQINAVRITSANEPDNFLIAPFIRVFGSLGFTISAVSTAAVAQRCGAFLIDVNRSSAFNTHQDSYRADYPSPYPAGPATLAVPIERPVATFAFHESQITGVNCNDPATASFHVQWCNMGRFTDLTNTEWTTQRGDYTDELPLRHFQSDYRPHPWPGGGNLWVDSLVHGTYRGPEPLTTFFLAFNAGLRLIQAQGSFGDLFQIKGFTGLPEGRSAYPDPAEGPPLTTYLDEGIRLTNLNNRGTININGSEVHERITPNFVTMGWVPINTSAPDNYNNLAEVLETTIGEISSQCPETSRKFIVIASDFRINCAPWDGTAQPCTTAIALPGSPNAYGYLRFQQARQYLIDQVLPILQERKISLTAIVDGQHIRPHFVNKLKPDCQDPTNHECFVKLEEARAYGYYGENIDLFESGSYDENGDLIDPAGGYGTHHSHWGAPGSGGTFITMDEAFAFTFAGLLPEVSFGESIPLAARLAIDSGGYICPMLPTMDANNYFNSLGQNPGQGSGPYYLHTDYREVNQPQMYAVEYLSKAEQAALCGQRTVGLHPYMLVTEP